MKPVSRVLVPVTSALESCRGIPAQPCSGVRFQASHLESDGFLRSTLSVTGVSASHLASKQPFLRIGLRNLYLRSRHQEAGRGPREKEAARSRRGDVLGAEQVLPAPRCRDQERLAVRATCHDVVNPTLQVIVPDRRAHTGTHDLLVEV